MVDKGKYLRGYYLELEERPARKNSKYLDIYSRLLDINSNIYQISLDLPDYKQVIY